MRVALGADHAGFVLKQHLRRSLEEKGYDVIDEGTRSQESCDYPDFAASVARDVSEGRAERGILICSTGVGMSIAANKIQGIRAALGTNLDEVQLLRSHNNANVLTLGAKYINGSMAESLVEMFLTTRFEGGERHSRRIGKIAALENPPAETAEPETNS